MCWSGGYATLDRCSLDANYRNASQSIYKSQDVVQVNIPAESGDMGILANHVPSIEQLKAGVVEVIEEGGAAKQFFRALITPPNLQLEFR